VEENLTLRRYDTPEDCKRYALKRPESQTLEVNLSHRKQEDTWRKI